MKTSLVAFLFVCFVCSLLPAQDRYYLQSYNNVLDVKVSGDDLWVGTTKGLVQFNKNTGAICGVYNASNSPIPSDNVFDVEIGPNGNVWLATQKGLFRFNGFGFQLIENGLFIGIGFDDVGNVYASTKLEYEFCNVSYALSMFQNQEGYITSVDYNDEGYCYTHKDKVLCGGGGSGGGCWESSFKDEIITNGEFIEVDSVDFDKTLLIDSIGNFWSTLDRLSYINPNTGVIEIPQTDTLVTDPTMPWLLKFNTAAQDSIGQLWLASTLGVFRFDGQDFVEYNEGLLGSQSITSIDIDEAGTVFIGSESGGIYRLNSNHVWESWLVDGLISNNVNMASNTVDKYAFGSIAGVSVWENGIITTHTAVNSILPTSLPFCKIYVDESNGVWVNANDSVEQVYYLSNASWMLFDSTNSALLSDDFTFIESNDPSEIWLRYDSPSIGAAGARFQSGIFTNFVSMDSLYENTVLVENKWTIEGYAAVKNEDGVITTYPIPESMFDSTCVGASDINADGLGIILIDNWGCGASLSKSLLRFNGTGWEVINSTFGLWGIGQIEFRGLDIYIGVSPEYWNCDPAHYKIIKPNNQIQSFYLPDPENISPNFGPVRDGSVYTILDGAGDLWAHYVSYYGDECWGSPTQDVSSRAQLFKKDGANFVHYAGPHCAWAYPRSMTTRTLDGNGRMWIQGALGIYSTEPFDPMLAVFEKGSDCAASAVACVMSGLQDDYQFEWPDGNTDPLRFSMSAGSFSCTATDANGVIDEVSIVLNTGDAIVVESSFTYESTPGLSDASISIDTVIGVYPPFDYLWNTGDTTAQVDSLSPGVYEVTITDQVACTNVLLFPLYDVLQITSTQTDVTCFGENNGTIDLVINGGLPPYEIDWGGSSITSISRVNLSPGAYSVTVYDNTTFVEELTITITQPALIDLINGIELQPEITPGLVEALLDFSGGSPPYIFNWSNGDTTEILSGVAPGLYSVTITDANGCNESAEAWLYYPMSVESVYNETACQGDSSGMIDVIAMGGVPPYNYNWNFTNLDTSFVDNLTSNNYYLTISDSYQETESLVIPIWLTPLYGVIDYVGNQLEVNITEEGTPPYTYEWSTGDTTAVLEVVDNGFYLVTVTDANDCSFQVDYLLTTVDTNEPEKHSMIKVFPNPTNSILHVQCKTCHQFELVSVDGKQIKADVEIGLGGVYELDLSSLPAAVYFLKIFDENHELLKVERVLLFK